MAHVQNFLDIVERIQEENVCIEDIPGLSDPDDSNKEENCLVD